MFESLELVFQSLELMFDSLEHRFIHIFTKDIHYCRFANREIREVECITNRKKRDERWMKGDEGWKSTLRPLKPR